MDCYLSLIANAKFKTNIKRSIFIGHAVHCTTEHEAKEFIKEISRQYKDATHNCWAYKVNEKGIKFNFSDAGEPHGSAGRPIFSAIESMNMVDVAIVVTRYFGGVKLGVRGLIDAYRFTAQSTLETAEKGRYCPGIKFSAEIDYGAWNDFTRRYKEGTDFNIAQIDYGASIKVLLTSKADKFDSLTKFFLERRIPIEKRENITFIEKL
ncbi:hypothetical protein AT15_00760 [Kosmotoga arenicorallina S304]|uniref:Impact N-terminal domain-containing protein n=1 Tax=Kosmotoga arenicorallina S304 TaxID=1453497 RepID=A0A176K0E2_9BACT|nr:YigZ family protein [Kosmotoga arenicorallina]OAA30077.1 hypothetical protein AT15_00760 [Kosmotoga arenicorallina S304]